MWEHPNEDFLELDGNNNLARKDNPTKSNFYAEWYMV